MIALSPIPMPLSGLVHAVLEHRGYVEGELLGAVGVRRPSSESESLCPQDAVLAVSLQLRSCQLMNHAVVFQSPRAKLHRRLVSCTARTNLRHVKGNHAWIPAKLAGETHALRSWRTSLNPPPPSPAVSTTPAPPSLSPRSRAAPRSPHAPP